jgi:3-oxoacyl-[acyl-carrier protein] reductase
MLFLRGLPIQNYLQINRLASLSAFNRIGEPEDIAAIVLFLASDEAKWINAQNIGVNGGMA